MNLFTVSALAGSLLSLALSYIPGISTRFASLPASQKRLALLATQAVIAVVLALASCQLPAWSELCGADIAGYVTEIITVFVSGIIGSQATFILSSGRKK